MGLDILGKHVPRKMLTENNGVRTLRNVQIGKTCDEQMPLWGLCQTKILVIFMIV